MKRVLMVTQRDFPGGIPGVVRDVSIRLDSKLYDVHVVFLYGGEGPIGEAVAKSGIPCHYLGLRSSRDVLAYRRLLRLVRELSPDIVHDHDLLTWSSTILGRCARLLVGHFHTLVKPPRGPKRRFFARVLVPRYRHWIAISDAVVESAVEHLRVRPGRCTRVYNGIDCARFGQLPDRDECRAQFGLPDDAPVGGFVGRLDCLIKGPDDFIRVAAKMPKYWHWLLVGGGDIMSSLKEQAARLGVGDRMHFSGELADVRRAYAAMDYLLVLTRHEPFGLVVLEGMAAGVPTIALETKGGMQEVLRGSPVLQVADRDLDAMASGLLSLSQSPSKVEDMKALGRRHVTDRFSLDQSARGVQTVYDDLLAEQGT